MSKHFQPFTVKVFDIEYDTDGEDVKGLPEQLFFKIDDPDFDLHTEIADLVSDATGFCIFGCNYEKVT